MLSDCDYDKGYTIKRIQKNMFFINLNHYKFLVDDNIS